MGDCKFPRVAMLKPVIILFTTSRIPVKIFELCDINDIS